MKVLRAKQQLTPKPTREEIECFRAAQEREKAERTLEDKLPKHLPLKIKIKKEKEKAFKDLNNDIWYRDFELEVTNTSKKPVYFLEFRIMLPEILSDNGFEIGIPLRYGRPAFIDFEESISRHRCANSTR